MKALQIILITGVLLASCASSKEDMNMKDCSSKENAIQVADKFLKKKQDIDSLKVEIEDKGGSWLVTYTLKDSLSLGGGAEITISKSDCRIQDSKLYQ